MQGSTWPASFAGCIEPTSRASQRNPPHEQKFAWAHRPTLAAMPTRSLAQVCKTRAPMRSYVHKRLHGVPTHTFLGRYSQVITISLCRVKHADANLPAWDFHEQPTWTAYANPFPRPPELPTRCRRNNKGVPPEY